LFYVLVYGRYGALLLNDYCITFCVFCQRDQSF
jgi:hypothetical protein